MLVSSYFAKQSKGITLPHKVIPAGRNRMLIRDVVIIVLIVAIAFVLLAAVWDRNYRIRSTTMAPIENKKSWRTVSAGNSTVISTDEVSSINGIPMILHQTFANRSVQRGLYENIQEWIKGNPEFQYIYWTDKDSGTFIKENFEPDVYHAYCTLIPGAARSDLFRYCVLYHYGGVYANVHLEPLNLIKMNLTPITHDGNSFIAVGRNNSLVRQAIDRVLSNVAQQLDLPIPRLTGAVMFETIVNGIKIHCPINRFCINSQKASVKYHHSELSKRNLVYHRTVPEDQKINNKSGPIPRNFLQTWSSRYVTRNMYAALASWTHHNPDYGYMYFDDEKCRQEVSRLGSDVLKAYDTLIPGAFKADLWRVCSLYLHGGIYMDADMTCQVDLENIMAGQDIVLCIDTSKCTFYNAVMCFKAKMPVLKKMIDYITTNVLAHRYDLNHLAVTGPIAITKVMRGMYPELFFNRDSHLKSERLRAGDYTVNGDNIRVLYRRRTKIKDKDDNVLIHSKYTAYDDERVSSGGSDYYYLWDNKLVYRNL